MRSLLQQAAFLDLRFASFRFVKDAAARADTLHAAIAGVKQHALRHATVERQRQVATPTDSCSRSEADEPPMKRARGDHQPFSFISGIMNSGDPE